MINTYNESSLHKTLKILYSQEFNGQTEVELFGHIYDIAADNLVIEIQTQNLSKLLSKTLDAFDQGYKVKIVYPLVERKWIETTDENGNILSCRKSPVTKSIYDIFDEITGLYPVLLNKNFSLEVVRVHTIEKRIKYDELKQTLNKSRRFRKDWLKNGKELKEVFETRTFSDKQDYLQLIPESIKPEFCAKDLAKALKDNKSLPSSASKKAHIMIWVLRHMELITQTEIKNRSHYYIIEK
ncbi:MAG: hypothetical protein MJ185_09645 [Treponema sp.]|nr:hypothetical protein [Treponema sp.]